MDLRPAVAHRLREHHATECDACISPSGNSNIRPELPKGFFGVRELCHNVRPYRTVPYRTVPYRTVPYRTVPYRTVPYRTVPYRTVPHRTVPHRTVPYHTAPYRTVPCRHAGEAGWERVETRLSVEVKAVDGWFRI